MAFTEFAAEDSLILDYEKAAREIFPLLKTAGTDFLIGQYATAFANILGNPGEFHQYVTGSHGEREERIGKLLDSYEHNLELLVRKTWCSPETSKEKDRILTDSASFLKAFRAGLYAKAHKAFANLAGRLSALIFGDIAETPDFIEWAFRIDPKLGLFSWFVTQMDCAEKGQNEADELVRTELLVGIYFLASL